MFCYIATNKTVNNLHRTIIFYQQNNSISKLFNVNDLNEKEHPKTFFIAVACLVLC